MLVTSTISLLPCRFKEYILKGSAKLAEQVLAEVSGGIYLYDTNYLIKRWIKRGNISSSPNGCVIVCCTVLGPSAGAGLHEAAQDYPQS